MNGPLGEAWPDANIHDLDQRRAMEKGTHMSLDRCAAEQPKDRTWSRWLVAKYRRVRGLQMDASGSARHLDWGDGDR
jgi:hypothetical protein